MTDIKLNRRSLLLAAGTAPAAVLPVANSPVAAAEPAAKTTAPAAMLVLTDTEAAFLAASADCMIPADALSPSGSDCGVVTYIDGQLASAWGGGARLYRDGPHPEGTPQQGTQTLMTPREILTTGITEANNWCRATHGATFDAISPELRLTALQQIEAGTAHFEAIRPQTFFNLLLDLTMEGMFADPIYGGNRDLAGWKLLGFPGLPATYADKIDAYRGKRYDAAPRSISDFL
jgi:gluconate 2-dehydrogenase gamma chain